MYVQNNKKRDQGNLHDWNNDEYLSSKPRNPEVFGVGFEDVRWTSLQPEYRRPSACAPSGLLDTTWLFYIEALEKLHLGPIST